MDRKLVPHHSHWGAFNAVVEDGRVVGAVPFDCDPGPSPLIEAIPDAVHSPTRITRPMVRSGWLQKGRISGAGRGREPFVPVEWEEALDLVTGELAGVRREQCPAAIIGGSQGCSSAGISAKRVGSCGGFWPRQADLSAVPVEVRAKMGAVRSRELDS
jgi:biotin/methionine sulfoxide reductase